MRARVGGVVLKKRMEIKIKENRSQYDYIFVNLCLWPKLCFKYVGGKRKSPPQRSLHRNQK